jgi:hypothetical protein
VKLWPDALDRLLDHETWQALPRHASWLAKRVAPATDLGPVCDEVRPLRALYLLVPVAPDRDVALRRLHGLDALLALLANGYLTQLLAKESGLLARQLEVFRKVVETTPVYALACPRNLDRLDSVVDAVWSGDGEQ